MNQRIPVAVLGCTGAVGQKLISLLAHHPWFEISELVASQQSAGQTYAARGCWNQPEPMPPGVEGMVIRTPEDHLHARILFSGLDAAVAGEVETAYARRGHLVISNARNHRMDPDVPLIIPEINGSQIHLLRNQPTYQRSGGGIVTNPNCSTIVTALALYPIYRKFGLDKVMVTTLQATSGAGYPGIPTLDILGNTLPYIAGEEEKMESEIFKILGTRSFEISATCNRVPVMDGHSICLSVKTRQPATFDALLDAFATGYPHLGLPSSPLPVVQYLPGDNRPQPRLDVHTGGGMTVSIGRLRPCSIFDWKFTALGHNTIRGAAGASILNAEWLLFNKL